MQNHFSANKVDRCVWPAALLLAFGLFQGERAFSQSAAASREATGTLEKRLSKVELPDADIPNADIQNAAFASVPLTREDAAKCKSLLWESRLNLLRNRRQPEMDAKAIKLEDKVMKFDWTRFGEKPDDGWSLYISMHGGGGTASRVNDRQWENQKRLYKLEEGIYVAPRAPTDTWNLWHQAHIDDFFERLIENFVAIEDVDPNRIYLMGYSAGGDGVFQLAPRMSDRWAAAAMMAGHPNETSALGLRNLPFALQVGGRDAAYKRNEKARLWEKELARLQSLDPDGYEHFVKIYPGKGHWMDREDAVAIPWMAKFRRNSTPSHLVWKQDDVTHPSFYWLAVEGDNAKPRSLIRAEIDRQTIKIDAEAIESVIVRLDDRLVDLDKPVVIVAGDTELYRGKPARTIQTLVKTLENRGDPFLSFPAEVTVELP